MGRRGPKLHRVAKETDALDGLVWNLLQHGSPQVFLTDLALDGGMVHDILQMADVQLLLDPPRLWHKLLEELTDVEFEGEFWLEQSCGLDMHICAPDLGYLEGFVTTFLFHKHTCLEPVFCHHVFALRISRLGHSLLGFVFDLISIWLLIRFSCRNCAHGAPRIDGWPLAR